jgi:hypothetical protein
LLCIRHQCAYICLERNQNKGIEYRQWCNRQCCPVAISILRHLTKSPWASEWNHFWTIPALLCQQRTSFSCSLQLVK